MLRSLFLLFLTLTFLSGAIAQTAEKYSNVRISLQGKRIEDVARLGIEVEHAELDAGHALTTVLSAKEIKDLQKAGFSYQILVDDMSKWVEEQYLNRSASERGGACQNDPFNAWPTPQNYSYGSMGGFHTYAQMMAVLDDMHAKFPNLISARKIVSDTIVTHENRPLWYVKISDNPEQEENEPEVLYTALHHAREPNSAAQLLFFMWYLLENYGNDERVRYILNNEELYFIPCVNPDGYLWNETTNPNGGGFWRKNRRDNGDNTRGVDLNRNYGWEWGFDSIGSSPDPATEIYRGPAPFSEPETRMIRDFERAHTFIFTLNYHTRGDLLIYPWGYNNVVADSSLVSIARLMIRENRFAAGTSKETVLYGVNGTSDDWMYGETGSLAYTPEVGLPTYGFWPPFDRIEYNNKRCLWQNLVTALCPLQFGIAKDLSNVTLSGSSADIPMRVQRFGFQPGNLTLSLKALSSNILSVSAPQQFSLTQLESQVKKITVSIDPGTPFGAPVVWVMELSNGLFTQRDTINKIYTADNTATFYANDCSSTSSWQGNWGLSTDYFVSPPSSLTDSPSGNYEPDNQSLFVLDELLEIPAFAVRPQLRFYARWDLQEDYDAVKVQAFGSNGKLRYLCGLYTEEGTTPQGAGEPVYDGPQQEWVEEFMSLEDYIDSYVQISFQLNANDADERDGFYFDDLLITYFDPVSGTQVAYPLNTRAQSQPNPADESCLIQWQNKQIDAKKCNIRLFNNLGQALPTPATQILTPESVRISTQALAPGLYWLYADQEGQRLAPLKIIVQH